MQQLENLKIEFAEEALRFFNYFPILVGLGIGLFFGLDFDPTLGQVSIVGLGVLSVFLVLRALHHNITSTAILLIGLGFVASFVRMEASEHEVMRNEYDRVRVEGTIQSISFQDSRSKLMLSDLEIEDVEVAPKYISISTRIPTNHLALGDRIEFRANLMPPPKPTLPGGFNYSFYAYFKQIGAIGVTVGRIEIIEHRELSGFWEKVNIVRAAITNRLYSVMSEDAASIASALIVGDAKRIPVSLYDSIRTSGIAHVIAISGLHIVTVVGLVFFISRYLFGRSAYIVARYDIKKWAAIISILFSAVYLLIAGMPISAQRAFIMSSLVMLAIVLDRDPDAMRALSIAALLILIFFPESLFSASFQMSFAACYGLIGAYKYTSVVLVKLPGNVVHKYVRYFLSLTCATIIAGLVTTPFVIYHFNQFSTYSVVTNFAVIPLVDFVIMPSVVLSMLAMPLHLEYMPLKVLELSINCMIYVSNIVSNLPNASLMVPKMSDTMIVVVALSLFMLLSSGFKARYIFLGPVLAVFMLMKVSQNIPDVILDKGGKLFALKYEGELFFSSLMPAKFVRKTWQQAYGITSPNTIKGLDNCDAAGCTIGKVAISKTGDAACAEHSLIFNLSDELNCDNMVSMAEIRKSNGIVVYQANSNPYYISVASTLLKRKWN